MTENSLAEWFNPKDAVNRVTTPRKLNSKEIVKYNVDPYYMSFLNLTQFQEYETWSACINRTNEFLNFLDKKHGNCKNENILIISHLSVLNAICINSGHIRHSEHMFEMGKLIKLECLTQF